MILMCTWENTLLLAAIGLTEGGKAGFVWIFFIAWTSFIFINTSMAEMGSM